MAETRSVRDAAGRLCAAVLCAAWLLVQAAAAGTAIAAAPPFTATEMATIQRNEMLKQVLPADPWLVRQILDDIARQGREAFAPPDGIDPFRNPDLRSSPEAAYDLFQLLKKAASDKQARPAK